MQRQKDRGFFNGVLLGMTLSFMAGLVAVYLLTVLGIISVSVLEVPRVQLVFEWSRRNLGLSVLPFAITLGLYIRSLRMLQHWLDDNRSPDEISQLEHLNDVWTSLFFGIGVIWTAIGMRSALLFALGDPDVAAQAGAYAVLQRLVDGGILTALTTTIVGGIGGYMMRVTKSSLLGTRLSRYYEEHEQHHANRVEALLGEIRESLDGGARTRTTLCIAGRTMIRRRRYARFLPASAAAGSDTDALQTDVMRFMSIIGLCLMAIFALVQGIPVQESGKPAQALQAAKIREDIRTQQQQLRELLAELHALKSEKDSTQQDLAQLAGQTQQARRQRDRLALQLEDLDRQLEQGRRALADIEQDSMQEEHTLAELRGRHLDAQVQLDRARKDIAALRRRPPASARGRETTAPGTRGQAGARKTRIYPAVCIGRRPRPPGRGGQRHPLRHARSAGMAPVDAGGPVHGYADHVPGMVSRDVGGDRPGTLPSQPAGAGGRPRALGCCVGGAIAGGRKGRHQCAVAGAAGTRAAGWCAGDPR